MKKGFNLEAWSDCMAFLSDVPAKGRVQFVIVWCFIAQSLSLALHHFYDLNNVEKT